MIPALVCDDCDIVIVDDPDAILTDPWGAPTGSVLCDNCREARWYHQQEKLMEET